MLHVRISSNTLMTDVSSDCVMRGRGMFDDLISSDTLMSDVIGNSMR